MRDRVVLPLAAIIVVLIMWGISFTTFDVQNTTRNILELLRMAHIQSEFRTAATAPELKCSLSRHCPADHFAFHIRSGAASVVGPKICFDGKIIMSHVMNNVGPGLNIVLVNGENGVVENNSYLNMNSGKPEDILAYLKKIKPGVIVLVASFYDVTPRMTNEMREIFVGMGSTLIKSVRSRDSWVFAGRAGTKNKSQFEKRAVNDGKTNLYDGWPHVVEVGGCLPRTSTDRTPL